MNYTFMSEYSLYYILKDSVSYKITEYLGGYHIKVEYPNGYGASIVKHDSSYGRSEDLWELAVLHNGAICYDTPMTDDVIGYLDDDEVGSFCTTIRKWSDDEWQDDNHFEEACEYYDHYMSNYDRRWQEEMELEQFDDIWDEEEDYMEDADERYD